MAEEASPQLTILKKYIFNIRFTHFFYSFTEQGGRIQGRKGPPPLRLLKENFKREEKGKYMKKGEKREKEENILRKL